MDSGNIRWFIGTVHKAFSVDNINLNSTNSTPSQQIYILNWETN